MAKEPKVQVFTDGDEREEIRVNGQRVASTNHDEHGWDGMEIARTVAQRMAEVLGGSYEDGLPLEDDEIAF